MSKNLTSSEILRAKFGENKQNQQVKDEQAKDQQKIEKVDLKADLIEKSESTIPSDIVPAPVNIATLPPQNLRPAEFATPANIAIQVEEPITNSSAEFATLSEIVPTTKGFLKLPNSILDQLPEILDTNEQLMYIHLYRLSHGFHEDSCLVSLAKLCNLTKLSERTVQKTINNLEKKHLITRIGNILGGKGQRGMRIRVANFATPAEFATQNSPANSADIKLLKYNLIKEYKKLARQINQILGERSISELCYEMELACKKAKVKFDKQIFNENIKYIMKK